MRITFDRVKNDRNIATRGLPFDLVPALEWDTAVIWEDTRMDYGERRLRVLAFLGERLHAAVVTRRGDAMHVISFRKANQREVRRYGEEKR